MRKSRWRVSLGVVVAGAVLVPAALAWACVGLMSLTTGSSTVQAGGKVTVIGREFYEGQPVEIHLDSPTGRLLLSVPAPTSTMTSKFSVDVTIPTDVPNGTHVLVATQPGHYMNSGSPARATIYVGTSPPAPAAAQARAADLSRDKAPTGVALALIGLGTALIALLVAGLITVLAGRRSGGASPSFGGAR